MTPCGNTRVASKDVLSESDDEFDEGLQDEDLLGVDDEYDEGLDDDTLLRSEERSPLERLPEELLCLILDNLLMDKLDECCGRSKSTSGSIRSVPLVHRLQDHIGYCILHPLRLCAGSGVPDLKNLRLACRDYTYLPRVLRALFESVRLAPDVERLKRQQRTDITKFKPYFRRVLFDPEMSRSHDTSSALSSVQLAWTKILRQLSGITIFHVGQFDDEYMGTILASLSAAQAQIEHLYLNNNTEGKVPLTTRIQLERAHITNLRTLVFNSVDATPNVHHMYVGRQRDAAVMDRLLQQCGDSIRHIAFGDICFVDWLRPSDAIPNFPNLEELYIGVNGRFDFSAFAAFLRTGCPALKKLTLNKSDQEQELGGWSQLWHAIRDHPIRMQLEFQDLRCKGSAFSFSHFTGEESRQHDPGMRNDTWRDLVHSLAIYLSGLGEWTDELKFFEAEPEPDTDAIEEEDWEPTDGWMDDLI